MSIFDETGSVERPTFFNGQELFAADLDGLADFNRALRWLHNRSLHQPGVGNGFSVVGKRGDREVSVQPGYALDSLGREIVLLDTHVEPVPPVSGESGGGPAYFDLAVSYPSDSDLEEAETRDGVCEPRGVVRLREKPIFCWIRLIRDVTGTLRPVNPTRALEIQNGLAIVLARAEVLECQLNADLSVAVRRNARPPRQPHIACATVHVAWRVWSIGGDGAIHVGLRGRVDASVGKFSQPPRYAARIEGVRPLTLSSQVDFEAEAWGTPVFDLPPYVHAADVSGFECYVPVVPHRGGLDLSHAELLDLVDLAEERWRVTWLGIED